MLAYCASIWSMDIYLNIFTLKKKENVHSFFQFLNPFSFSLSFQTVYSRGAILTFQILIFHFVLASLVKPIKVLFILFFNTVTTKPKLVRFFFFCIILFLFFLFFVFTFFFIISFIFCKNFSKI